MNRDYKPLRNKEIVEKGVESEAVLYNKSTSSVHIMNRTALQIWKLSDGKHTIDDIENNLKKIFKIPEKLNIFSDIEKTISDLKENGLIH